MIPILEAPGRRPAVVVDQDVGIGARVEQRLASGFGAEVRDDGGDGRARRDADLFGGRVESRGVAPVHAPRLRPPRPAPARRRARVRDSMRTRARGVRRFPGPSRHPPQFPRTAANAAAQRVGRILDAARRAPRDVLIGSHQQRAVALRCRAAASTRRRDPGRRRRSRRQRSGGDAIDAAASAQASPALPDDQREAIVRARRSSVEIRAPPRAIQACGSRAPGRPVGTYSRTGFATRGPRAAVGHQRARSRSRSRAAGRACRSARPGSRSRRARVRARRRRSSPAPDTPRADAPALRALASAFSTRDGPAFGFVAVEQRRWRPARFHRGELPGEIVRVLHAAC